MKVQLIDSWAAWQIIHGMGSNCSLCRE